MSIILKMYLFRVSPAKILPSRQLTLVLDFIYNGEVDVMQDDLDLFLNAAIDLKVQGLTPASPGQTTDGLTSTPDRGLKKSLFRYIHTDKIFQF